ncbi:MAG: DUF4136 domain-containing protein [Nitrospiraceae bacterium]|nr:MAG: DUF4136 domain-containing protein [Nitrospiraceae bacterium]
MQLSRYIIMFCLAGLAMGCTTVNVDYDYDPEADFAGVKSYDWFPVPRENARYDLLIKQIRSEMVRQLNERGYERVSDNPDVLIALHGGFQSRMDYLDWQYLYENYKPYWAKRRLDITHYEDQQLIADFIDVKSGSLVYRATATTYIPEATPGEREKVINKAVMKILENFPPVIVSDR